MASYGSFETVAELHRTGLGSVWSARRGAGDPAFAIKLCEPDTLIYGREAAAGAVATFLEQAGVQQKAGGDAWAPVHESGVQPSGAYLVTDLFGRSLDRLIAGRYRFDGPGLYRLAGAIVRGLKDVQRNCGRGHGNLKPSNVLIEAKQGSPLVRVVLSDPASGTKARSNPGADARALGALLYQCVTHQPFREGAYPVPEGREWSALGGSGRKWLALVNRLLDPHPQGAPLTLEQIDAEVEECGKARARRKGPLLIGAAAGMLVVGGVGGFLMFRGGSEQAQEAPDVAEWPPGADEEWKEYCLAYQHWGGELIEALDRSVGPELGGGPRRGAYAGDADLDALVKQFDAAKSEGPMDPLGIAGLSRGDLVSLSNSAPEGVRKSRPLGRFRRVLGAFKMAEAMLEGEWGKVRSLKGQAEEWRARGWTAPAAGLESVIEPVKPSVAVDAVTRMDGVLIAGVVAGEAQERQTEVERVAQELAATGDEVLKRFGEWGNAVGAAGSRETGLDAVKELDARLGDAAATGRQLLTFLAGGWSNVDGDFLKEQSPVYKETAATPEKALFERWLAEAGNPKYTKPDPEGDPTKRWTGEARLGEVQSQVDRLNRELNVPVGDEVTARLNRVVADMERLRQMEWTRRNVETKTALAATTQTELDKLWGELSRRIRDETVGRAESLAAAKTELQAKSEVVPNSAAINAVWVTWRDAYVNSLTEQNFEQVPADAKAAEDLLVTFNQALPTGLTGVESGRPWHAGLARMVLEQRESRAASALEKYRPSVPTEVEAVEAALLAEAKAFGDWVRGIDAAMVEATALENLLNEGYGLEETPGAGGAPVGERYASLASMPGFAAAAVEFGPITERVEVLKSIGAMTNVVAVAGVLAPEAPPRPEAVVAAWRRLGQLPTWPASIADLRQGLEYRRRAAVVSGLVPNEARKQELEEELARSSVERWARGFAVLTTGADVEAAIGLMAEYGAGRAAVTDPRLTYNLLAYDLKQVVMPKSGAAPDDPRVVEAGRPFLEGLRALPPAVAQQGKVSAVIRELDPIVSGTEPPPPPFDPNAIGPGLAGWSGEQLSGVDHLRYTKAGRDGPLALEFRRIEPPEGVPAYLCTTETSVALVLGVLSPSAPEMESLRTSTHEGPAVWSTANGPPEVSRDWYEAQRATLNRFPEVTTQPTGSPQFTPTPDLPFQQVSPAAALLVCRLMGCRLPTAEEWRAAYAAVQIPLEQWNLRDQAWAGQHAHVAGVVQMLMAKNSAKTDVVPWPDMGAFNRTAYPDGADAASRPENDGVAWFRPVTTAPGHPFANLVGNVAELVFADPAVAEAVAPTPEAVTAAVRAGAARFFVIGGSALSAPAMSVDQPHPVDGFDVTDMIGFADVGFRPAFSAEGTTRRETYAARVSRQLTADPYLYP